MKVMKGINQTGKNLLFTWFRSLMLQFPLIYASVFRGGDFYRSFEMQTWQTGKKPMEFLSRRRSKRIFPRLVLSIYMYCCGVKRTPYELYLHNSTWTGLRLTIPPYFTIAHVSRPLIPLEDGLRVSCPCSFARPHTWSTLF